MGHHREPATVLTGACRLDRCVQGKQVGLERDFVDDLDDLGDILRGRVDALHGRNHVGNLALAVRGHIRGRQNKAVGVARGFGVGRDLAVGFLGAGRHLIHGGGRDLRVGRKRARGLVHLDHSLRHLVDLRFDVREAEVQAVITAGKGFNDLFVLALIAAGVDLIGQLTADDRIRQFGDIADHFLHVCANRLKRVVDKDTLARVMFGIRPNVEIALAPSVHNRNRTFLGADVGLYHFVDTGCDRGGRFRIAVCIHEDVDVTHDMRSRHRDQFIIQTFAHVGRFDLGTAVFQFDHQPVACVALVRVEHRRHGEIEMRVAKVDFPVMRARHPVKDATLMRGVGVEDVHVLAHEVIGAEMRQGRAQLVLNFLEHFHRCIICETDHVIRIRNQDGGPHFLKALRSRRLQPLALFACRAVRSHWFGSFKSVTRGGRVCLCLSGRGR